MRERLEDDDWSKDKNSRTIHLNKKRNLINGLKQVKGITLVALVITIIIIIILSTVAISFAFGDNGLIKRAEDAKKYYTNDTAYTEETITNAEAYLEEVIWNVKMVKSADGVTVPVPIGFTASSVIEKDGRKAENTVAGGFVIYQGYEPVTNENVAEEQKSRNQFVWIPVNEEDLAEMYNTTTPETAEDTVLSKSSLNEETTVTKLYSKLRVRDGDIYTEGVPAETTNVREPDILLDTTEGDAADRGINLLKSELGYSGTNTEILKNFAQDMVDEYEAVFNSIKKYGGFYVGRYELTGTADTPTVQREQDVLTAPIAERWYGLKNACNKIVNNDKVESIMIYGNQWDEIMDWLVDTGAKNSDEVNVNSSSWGNYRDSSEEADIEGHGNLQQSGYSDAWSANNIYDLAGNYWDWTQEAYEINSRVYRRRNLSCVWRQLSIFCSLR